MYPHQKCSVACKLLNCSNLPEETVQDEQDSSDSDSDTPTSKYSVIINFTPPNIEQTKLKMDAINVETIHCITIFN